MTSKEYIKTLETSVNAMKQNNTRDISIIGTTSYFESMVKTLKQDLERLEELEKAQDLEIGNLEFIDDENKYQVAIRVLKEAFIVLGKSDITDTCWFKFLEELEKENQELKESKRQLLHDGITLATEIIKLKEAIEIIKSKEVDITCFLYSNSYAFYNFYTIENELEPLSLQEYKLLKEVLGNE